MNKTLFFLTCILGTSGFYACRQPVPEPELEQFMSVVMAGAKNPAVKSLKGAADTAFYVQIAYGGTTNYRQGDITAQVQVDLSLTDAFNTANGTGYLPAPAGAYALESDVFVIADGSNVSQPVKLTVRAGLLDPESEYLLPLTIVALEGALPLNEELKTLYIVFRGAGIDDTFGKDAWEVKEVSSEWGPPEVGATKAFDGDVNTYWHTNLTGIPAYLAVDMKKPWRIQGFLFTNRQDYEGNQAHPKRTVFEVSDDGAVWTKVREFGEFPQVYEEQRIPLDAAVTVQFFRVSIESSWSGQSWTYIAEISVY
jgi:hypothetical protein